MDDNKEFNQYEDDSKMDDLDRAADEREETRIETPEVDLESYTGGNVPSSSAKILEHLERVEKLYSPMSGMYEDLYKIFVVREGGIGDWACYSGIFTSDNWHSFEFECLLTIAEHGDKLSEREALLIFPHLSDKPYRR